MRIGLLGVAIWVIASTPVYAEPASDLREPTEAYKKWLDDSGISKDIEFGRLRYISEVERPDAKVLQIDLRFRTQGSSKEKEQKRFEAWLEDYQRRSGNFLLARLFYKLVLLSGWNEELTVVRVRVMEDTVEVRPNPESMRLVCTGLVNRSLVENHLNPADRSGKPLALTSAQVDQLTKELEESLVNRFTQANEAAGLSPPLFAKSPRSSIHLNLVVSGIRQQILKQQNLWEKLQVIVHVTRSENEPTQIYLYVDGHFASGVGKRAPEPHAYDANPMDQSQIDAFSAGLLREIEDRLVKRESK